MSSGATLATLMGAGIPVIAGAALASWRAAYRTGQLVQRIEDLTRRVSSIERRIMHLRADNFLD